MKSLIIGAGTYGQVYLSYLLEAGIEIVGFLDDNKQLHGERILDTPVIGSVSDLETLGKTHGIEAVYCPLGDNRRRVELLEYALSLGYHTPNFIHPSVIISPNVSIGERGVYLLPATVIMPCSRINNFVMASVNSSISHHTTVEEGVFLSFGANVGALVNVGKYSYIGINATVMTGVRELGENCLVGAGAVVTKDVPQNAVVAGVPAKILRYKE